MHLPPPLPPGATQIVVEAPRAVSFKTKIEPWHIEVAARALSEGLPLSNVAGLLGITRQTMTKWRELGMREDCTDPLLTAFAAATEQARAKACLEAIGYLKLAAQTDWRAALELLKASDPDTWAPKSSVKVEATVAPAAPTRDYSRLSEEQFRQLQELDALTAVKADV
jgi:hypothetical protein